MDTATYNETELNQTCVSADVATVRKQPCATNVLGSS